MTTPRQRYCELCGGRGGTRAGGKWIRCSLCNPRITAKHHEINRSIHEPPGRRSERQLAELVHALDVATAALNDLRTNPHSEITGAVKWMLAQVIAERARAQDALNRQRNQTTSGR